MSSAWYGADGNNGTVSVTINSPNVVGAATAWLTNKAVPQTNGYGFLGPDGRLYGIQSCTGDGAITLMSNYQGATLVGAPYAIVPVQGPIVALLADIATLLNSSGYSQLAALQPVANDGLRFKAGVWVTRSLIQDLTDFFSNVAEVAVASAATTNLGAASVTSPRVRVTGATTITSFGTVPNCLRLVTFAAALTLTHNAATLALRTGMNRITAAGDVGIYASDAAGNWTEIGYIGAADLLATSGTFVKSDSGSPAFVATSSSTLSIKAGTVVGLGSAVFNFAAQTAVQMPALTAGTDYAIYICNDGTVRADANFSAPTGFTAATSRQIGGFHYAPGGNAAAQAGGDANPAINPYSIWDIKWRPVCPDPRGMALVGNRFWCDIYVCNVNPEINGTSRYNMTIADGSSPPKKPTVFGGDGNVAYGEFNWWDAAEVMSAAGKQLLSYDEFAAAMYGTTEGSSGGTDPGATILRQAYTSRWGIMLATGNMWVWSRDFSYRSDGADLATSQAFGWKDNAQQRGQVYTQGTYGLVAAVFGGDWSNAAYAGSRASNWDAYPWDSFGNRGARGRCDHLRLA